MISPYAMAPGIVSTAVRLRPSPRRKPRPYVSNITDGMKRHARALAFYDVTATRRSARSPKKDAGQFHAD